MTNSKLLEDRIQRSSKKKEYLAQQCNMSRTQFYKACNNQIEFKVNQIQTLCNELNITKLTDRMSIFFA